MLNDIFTGKLNDTLEEPANMFTHGLGLLLSMIGFVFLVMEAAITGGALRIVACVVFGSTMMLLYASSTLYHSFQNEKIKHFFRIMDHSSIFVFIAGSYTPFMLVILKGAWGWSIFGVVWGVTLIGIVIKIFFTGRFDKLTTAMYLAMGWVIVVAIWPLMEVMPAGGWKWLIAGGLSYSAGVYFYMREKPFDHAIWHMFVMGGSVSHYVGIYNYVALPV